MAAVYLGLGSNLGDREAHLGAALSALARLRRTKLLRSAPVYETRPVGGPAGQGLFLNTACEVATALAPEEFLREIHAIERGVGRLREREAERWGPRVIDIDILFWGDAVMEEDDLIIPHPRLAERAFVLLPLADLEPGLRHPALGATVGELLLRLRGGRKTTELELDWEHEGIRRLSL